MTSSSQALSTGTGFISKHSVCKFCLDITSLFWNIFFHCGPHIVCKNGLWVRTCLSDKRYRHIPVFSSSCACACVCVFTMNASDPVTFLNSGTGGVSTLPLPLQLCAQVVVCFTCHFTYLPVARYTSQSSVFPYLFHVTLLLPLYLPTYVPCYTFPHIFPVFNNHWIYLNDSVYQAEWCTIKCTSFEFAENSLSYGNSWRN
jgi:hypothetical protein